MSPPPPRPCPPRSVHLGALPTGGQRDHRRARRPRRPGHLWADDPVARTGCTVILPTASLVDSSTTRWRPVTAALNGAGESRARPPTAVWDLESPVVLDSDRHGRAGFDAIVDATFDEVPGVGDETSSPGRRRVRRLTARRHPPRSLRPSPTGAEAIDGRDVWSGGRRCRRRRHRDDHDGDQGRGRNASRVIAGLGTVGVSCCQLRRLEAAARRWSARRWDLTTRRGSTPKRRLGGSVHRVVMTDIPLDARQLERVSRRVGLGLGRVGSVAHHGSGEISSRHPPRTVAAVERPASSIRGCSPTSRSTPCSRPWSTPAKRPSPMRCSLPTPSPASMGIPSPACRSIACSNLKRPRLTTVARLEVGHLTVSGGSAD